MLKLLLLTIYFIVPTLSYEFPPGVTLCHRTKQNFEKCLAESMTKSAQILSEGDKKLEIPKLEPFFVEEFKIAGKPGQSVSLDQKYKNVFIHGITNSRLQDFNISMDENNCYWQYNAITPKIHFMADYEIKGQILVFPLNSAGKCNITQINLKNIHKLACQKYTKNGNKTYIKITDYSMTMSLEEIYFDFDNLFKDNEQISQQIGKTINENSLSIFQETKSGFERVFSAIHLTTMNKVFNKIPFDNLFLP